MNRICRNSLLVAARGGTGNFPIGTTLVKEQYGPNGQVAAISMETRVNANQGRQGWYFWRRERAEGTNSALNASGCAGCHANAPRDLVWSAGL